MSGDDNIRDVHDEDEHDFDEDFILEKDDSPDSNQPKDPDAVSDSQAGDNLPAGEEGDDQAEEPALGDDQSLVLEEQAQPTILGSGDEDDYLLEDDLDPGPRARAKTLEDIFSAQEEKLKTTPPPEDRTLFDTAAISSSNEFDVGDARHFKEAGGLGWEGEDTDLESLGVSKPAPIKDPTSLGDPQELLDADAAAMEIEQDSGLELVEFDADLDRPASPPASQAADRSDEFAVVESDADEAAADGADADEFAVEEPAAGELAADEFAADEFAADEFAADEFAADELAADEFAADEFAVDESAPDESVDEFAVDEFAVDEFADELADEFADEFAVEESGAAEAETDEGDDATPWVLDEAAEALGSELEPAPVVGSRDDADPGEGWEPLDESSSLHEGGVPQQVYAGEEDYEPGYEEELREDSGHKPDYAEYKARFAHRHEAAEAAEPDAGDVLEPLPPRRSRGLLAAAAVILVLGLAAAAYVKPQAFLDLFGVKPEMVEVVEVRRPGLDVDSRQPEPPVVKPPVAKAPTTPPVVEPPVVKAPVVKEPTKPPAVTQPVIEPVVRPVPYTPLAPPRPEAPRTGVTAVPLNDADRIPFGAEGEEGYMRGIDRDALPGSDAPEVLRRDFDLVLGSKALAQLMNNNIFLGRVKALDSTYVTLRLERGEVTLPLVDIRVLTHLAQDEYRSLQNLGKDGFVYLRNSNRLAGVIVAQRDDAVILQVKSNRVVIPKSEIEHVQEAETKKEVQFSEEDTLEKDDWVRRMVEDELRKRRRRGSRPPR